MSEPTTYAELIDLAMARHDVKSYRRLEAISRDAGRLISHTTLSALHKGNYNRDTTKEMRGNLAWLAGVHERVAHAIAGKPHAPFELPDDADSLTGDQREAVLSTVRAFIKANKVARARLGKSEHLAAESAPTRTDVSQSDYDLAHYPDFTPDPVQRARLEQDEIPSQAPDEWEPS